MRDFLVHFFLPHHTNNHRARALHHDVMFLYVFAFLAFQVLLKFVAVKAPDILGFATNIYVDQLLSMTNAKRQAAGLTPLTLNSQLSQAAALKAQDMFANNYWAHNSPAGKTPWDFIRMVGYSYSMAGENLAKNFSDSNGVVEAWMASPSHKDNIMKSSYRDIGFAIVNGTLNGEETTLVVQMFGSSGAAPVVRPVAAARPENIPAPTRPFIRPTPTVKIMEPTPASVPALAFGETSSSAKPLAIGQGESSGPVKPSFLTPLFLGVTVLPFMDIPTLNKFVAYGFAGFLIALFVADMYLIGKRRVVRASGNTLTHILFVIAMTLSFALVSRGRII